MLHTNQIIWDYFTHSRKESTSVSVDVDMWYLKEGVAQGRIGGGSPLWSNTSQRGFQQTQRVNGYIVFPLRSRRQLNILLGLSTCFLFASKTSGLIPTLFGKILKSERMWSLVSKCSSTHGIHNSEKWRGAFISSQCESLKFGVQYRFVQTALATQATKPLYPLDAPAFLIALLKGAGPTLWHRLLMLLTSLLFPLFFISNSGLWIP